MNRFHEKTVIVTGAGSGIGEATVRRFAEEGANVVLAGRRLAPMQRVAEDFSPDRTLVLQIDVSVRQDVQRMIEAALVRFQKLDVLVNNAGVQIAGDVLKNSLENWRKVAATNLDGVVYSSSLALPHLIRSQGCIVNVASVSGLAGDWGGPYYCAAKGAVVNFTRAMALDHGVQGVRINAVCPSLVMTPMTGHFSVRPRRDNNRGRGGHCLPGQRGCQFHKWGKSTG